MAQELSHLVKMHLADNLMKTYHYGDLRKQLFFFKNEYTGYDALLVDHFTNTRYTLAQEQEADELAFVILNDMGLLLANTMVYRNVLKAIQGESAAEEKEPGNPSKQRFPSPSLHFNDSVGL